MLLNPSDHVFSSIKSYKEMREEKEEIKIIKNKDEQKEKEKNKLKEETTTQQNHVK